MKLFRLKWTNAGHQTQCEGKTQQLAARLNFQLILFINDLKTLVNFLLRSNTRANTTVVTFFNPEMALPIFEKI